ncbi:tetratricopeptide repeat protein [Candidatus Parabeggiatoa sp. HSG14]|uniref:tetratricopeptide repeat protein n=1 Tax=Candidatus Parabeggiatoa sp. HSG14 TaxID=3055593 RepID=UPI0025A893CE|nr:tetratricopeptide repeat protein [Thiotrichales bacterium HSG14]
MNEKNVSLESNSNSQPKKLVLLIHGIRTRAEWQEKTKKTIEETGTAVVVPIKYGYFNAFSFWFPFFTRKVPIEKLRWRIKDAISNHPDCNELLIIAHSFGTYATLQILKDNPEICPNRMIFCGSIVSSNFRWDQLRNRPEIINECGNYDIWPILAQSSTWGYGASGVFGFGVDKIHDRFHNFGHSDFLNQQFVKDFWCPWIYESEFVDTNNNSTIPWWKSILSLLPIRWMIAIILLTFVLFVAKIIIDHPPNGISNNPSSIVDEKRENIPDGIDFLDTINIQIPTHWMIVIILLIFIFFMVKINNNLSSIVNEKRKNGPNKNDFSDTINVQKNSDDITIQKEQGNIDYPGISSDRFQQLSEDLGVTKVALRNFFKITEKQQVTLDDLDNTLRGIAKHYKELMAKVATLNPDAPNVAKLIEQAKKALNDCEFDKAEELFNQATELKISAAQQQLIEAAEYQAANGKLKLTQLAYREAGEYYERAAKLLPAGNDETLAYYSNEAGEAFFYAALYDKAKPLYERSLAIREKIFGNEHPNVAESLNNLAGLHLGQGNYDQAKPLFERSLAIREEIFDNEHPDVAESLNNLALLHETQGNYDQAKPLHERSLAIREKVFGDEHPDIAESLNNLALLHQAQGDYDQAKPLFERALAIWEKVHGKEHPSVTAGLNNLALLHQAQGNYDQAKPLYERALAIREKIFGNEHPDVANSLNNLAFLHQVKGDYDQAKPLYERALAIWEKVHGKEHPHIAVSLNNLAKLYKAKGEYNKAKPLYERSLKIFKQFLGDDHPNVRKVTENYNDLLSKMAEQ